ncbi:uncharacterized protein PV09_01521 [Verruconis gallopava]|uniref:Uncharacterized protein n=1 Tax=Verruconis gallopava TaxID=253628 RepID=A0A0D2AM83_9PEZI|nr:uncharacterized protein PV09_01521 [Verruconis gallopava]KIW07565.1 hypothetical protein PV09_01521 [Verruconis gallopava]
MDVCADNSTACLLRQIYNQNNTYDWNPLNFGFTAAIGALALIVAIMTVFQGALAAGPGRIKASERAIGEWSRYSQSRMDRQELRVRTTTLVPFIQIFDESGDLPRTIDEEIGKRLKGSHAVVARLLNAEQESRLRKEKTSNAWVTLFGSTKSKETEQRPVALKRYTFNNYAASWANMLARLPDSKTYFTTRALNYGGKIEFLKVLPKALLCETDYLPSDVPAAVAFGTIRSIITLAAFVGCDEISADGDLLEARGNSMQVSFREHALLGRVAVSQDFPMMDTYRIEFDRQLYNTHESIGLLTSHQPFLTPGFPGVHSTMIILYTEFAPWLRATSFSSWNAAAVAKQICSNARPWKHLDLRLIICTIQQAVSKHGGTLYWHHSAPRPVFSADFPEITTMYSSDREAGASGMPRISGSCYEKTTYWADRSLYSRLSYNVDYSRAMLDGVTLYIPNTPYDTGRILHQLEYLVGLKLSDNQSELQAAENVIFDLDEESTSKAIVDTSRPFLVLLPLALRCCLDFLEDKFKFDSLPFPSKSHVRGAIRHQLHEIDHWLLRHIREEAVLECKTHLKNAMKNPPDLSTNPLDKIICPSMEQAWKVVQETDLVSTILAFRAVLMAAFLSTAADVSAVTGTALGRRVVQFL